jgi:colicin import membrane protein
VSWSTTLSVSPNKTVTLPLVRLEPREPVAARGAGTGAAESQAAQNPEGDEPAADSSATDETVPRSTRRSSEAAQARREAAAEARREAAEARREAAKAARERRASAAAERRAAAVERRAARGSDKTRTAVDAPAATRASDKERTGILRINSRPWSQVSIDGVASGTTPQMNLVLKPGTHTITLKNSEFGMKKSFTITIKPGEIVTRVVNLNQ